MECFIYFIRTSDTKNTITYTVKLKTTDEILACTKSYQYPFIHRQVQEQVNKMLEIIQPSESAWRCHIWVVPKKTNASSKVKWRIVIDFR